MLKKGTQKTYDKTVLVIHVQPDTRFDQRVTNLGAAMGHIRILERFIKDHVEEPECVALILEVYSVDIKSCTYLTDFRAG